MVALVVMGEVMVAWAGLFWLGSAGNCTVQARVDWPEHTRNADYTHNRAGKRVT